MSKKDCRVRNGSHYNKSLINRESLIFWIDANFSCYIKISPPRFARRPSFSKRVVKVFMQRRAIQV